MAKKNVILPRYIATGVFSFFYRSTRLYCEISKATHARRGAPPPARTTHFEDIALSLVYALTPKRVCDIPADRASVPEHAQRREDERAGHWPGGRAEGGGGGRRA